MNLSANRFITLQAFTAAAIVLPGLAHSAEDDQASFGYQYYEEGERIRNMGLYPDVGPHTEKKPITVDSFSAKVRISLTDRVKFAFNYLQDTWGGATPVTTAPLGSLKGGGSDGISGATPFLYPRIFFIDDKGNPLSGRADGSLGIEKRISHLFASASPETRRQADLKLDYEWDEMTLGLGGGVSEEPDYHSAFVNGRGRFDFNQKLTSLNLGFSYTTSDIGMNSAEYQDKLERTPRGHAGGFQETFKAEREDWGLSMGLTHVLNKNTILNGGMSFTHSAGFLENPYKAVNLYSISRDTFPIDNPADPEHPINVKQAIHVDVFEQRPDTRDQFTWNFGAIQYVEPLDAALHVDYSFFHDDWGINAHTFSGSWVQPVGWGWTLTPNIRYYSQTAADFYQPYFLLGPDAFVFDTTKELGQQLEFSKIPIKNFSSDHRLSGYGTLSGGLTISKQFAKGLNLAVSGEYYQHAGSLQLDGNGEGSYADFDYFIVNATLNVDLAMLSAARGNNGMEHSTHTAHSHHGGHAPAGVMFDHVLDKAGDVMVGYRYQYNSEDGDMLHASAVVDDNLIVRSGCPSTDGCRLVPANMVMNMHMIELMVAPTDWLTLMLMPQFMDMEMSLRELDGAPPLPPEESLHAHGGGNKHRIAGIGDTGMYALIKLFDYPSHQLHIGLGVSAPSGGVSEKLLVKSSTSEDDYIHYGMQLGSGTWDFKPSLTYTGQIDAWAWGAQFSGTKRLENRNESGYALGDMFQATAWGSYNLFNWLSASVRGIYSIQGAIKNRFSNHKTTKQSLKSVVIHVNYDADGDGNSIETNGIFDPGDVIQYDEVIYKVVDAPNGISGPMDTPSSYGGQFVDVGFGLSATVLSGALAGNKLSFEWLQPVYTDVNGYQLDRDGALSFTWSYGF